MNNDLIRRSDVLCLLHAFACGAKKYDTNDCKSEVEKICREELSKAVVGILGDFEKLMVELPAVPQPMSAVEYAREYVRMCRSHTCSRCPFRESKNFSLADSSCWTFRREHLEEAVAIVQKWAQEHPEEVDDED